MPDHPHSRRSIPNSFALMVYDYLDRYAPEPANIKAEDVLRTCRPDASNLLLGHLPVDQWRKLLQLASDYLQDPLLGLHLGQTVSVRHIGVLGYMIMASNTVAEALSRLNRYQRLIYDVTPMHVRMAGNSVELTWDAEHGRPGPLVDESAITALIQFCRNVSGETLCPERVQFINAAPTHRQPYEEYFGCPVEFDCTETMVRISIAVLQLPLRNADPAMLALMEQQADALLASLPTTSPLVDDVRKRIGRLLSEGQPDIQAVASSMELSPRSLQRRLSEASTSFRQEVGAVRREIAERYLRETRLGVTDIALMLGYSEHSAFTRGFIRWTGQTPQQYRQQHNTL